MKKYVALFLLSTLALLFINIWINCDSLHYGSSVNFGDALRLLFLGLSCSGALIKYLSSFFFLILIVLSIYKIRSNYLKNNFRNKDE